MKVPKVIQDIIIKFEDADEYTYKTCEKLKNDLEKHGWTIDYYLDADPYNLRPLKKSNNEK